MAIIAADLLAKEWDWDTTPIGYRAIRALFQVVTFVFYHEVEVHGLEHFPPDGVPTIVAANHSNSLTDPTLLIGTIPERARSMLRLTAKDTHFRQRTLASFLIESSGAIPMMRQKDHKGQKVTNENMRVFAKLIEGLRHGACVCLFPEGISRYYPTVAPLKTGVARIAAEVLNQEKDNADFKLAILPISLTYLHRDLFRSNVLVKINKPIYVSPGEHPGLVHAAKASSLGDGAPSAQFSAIRDLTSKLEAEIRSGCLEAPTWRVMRIAHTARRLYAPGGPSTMSLADYVGTTQAFCDIFAKASDGNQQPILDDNLISPLPTPTDTALPDKEYIEDLGMRLTAYQNQLKRFGLKDYRIHAHSSLGIRRVLWRLMLRVLGVCILGCMVLPGLVLWLPILSVTKERAMRFKKKGPAWDVLDEVAQTKLLHGLVMFVVVYIIACLLTIPFILITFWAIPVTMWLSLRWLEDLVATIRSTRSLLRLLSVGPRRLQLVKATRDSLKSEVVALAVARGLPADYEQLVAGPARPVPKGVVGAAQKKLRYFSLRRRRAKDWNEVFRFSDMSDYDEDGTGMDVTAMD